MASKLYEIRGAAGAWEPAGGPREPPAPRMPEPACAAGPWGGPTYRHRGARIECMADGRVCGLFLDGHPFSGRTFGAVGVAAALVDLWLDNHG